MHALLGETVVRQRLGDRKDPDFCALFTDINLAKPTADWLVCCTP
jgi:hypothetical protein